MKKTYTKPELISWGNVMDLTQVGFTHAGSDIKGGSIGHSNAGGKKK